MSADTSLNDSGEGETEMLEDSIFDCTRVIITPLDVCSGSAAAPMPSVENYIRELDRSVLLVQGGGLKEQSPRFLDDRD
jgi:hypothetical protein